MIRKDLVGDTAFRPDLHIGEDYVFLYENVIKGAAGVFLKQKWYYARSHGQNLSRDYAFSGFRTRFDRRKLVWESEERLGRRDYAAVQKADAVQCFFRCAERNKAYSEDGRRMRAVMKAHWGVLVPALGPRSRLRLFAAVFLPFAYPVVCRVYAKLRHRPDKT